MIGVRRLSRTIEARAASLPLDRLPELSPKRMALLFVGFLALSELAVLFFFSLLIGAALLLSTAGLALVFRNTILARLTAQSEQATSAASEALYFDPETRFPNRPHLIDQLTREIARSRRYSQTFSLALIEITRFEDFRASWGAETTRLATLHVAETIRRVARTSDFAARIDEGRFAVVLQQCDEAGGHIFGDRLSLAASNRPLKSAVDVKVPLYVGIDVHSTEYAADRYRGPLDFLSAAGGDVAPQMAIMPVPGRPRNLATDPQALRRQLVRDYYPEGKMDDFADAYRSQRVGARRVG